MKYVIRKLSAGFIFDELEQVRKQFVEALTYTMESAHVYFDDKASDPLDIYIEYDFQQKSDERVVYGFNLREELSRNFSLDVEKYHSSKQLLDISRCLRKLADDMESRYDSEPNKTNAKIQDKKNTEFANNVNRSYREVLKDALAEDEALRKKHSKSQDDISNEYKRIT